MCFKNQKFFTRLRLISDSEIILTIKGNNTQQILNNENITLYEYSSKSYKYYTFDTKPSEIRVNGNKINEIDYYVYNLSLEENNITIKFNKTLQNLNVIFYNLFNITNIHFNNFDFSQIISMKGMFYNCSNLTSIDLSNYDTSSVTDMSYLFNGCINLISLNLSNFNTSSVVDMSYMFNDCNNLISLDLSNFNTSSTIYMNSIFKNCYQLTSLNLTNFDTSSVINMGYMFYNCKNIISLDLTNFNTSSVTAMNSMFAYCNNLISIDLNSFKTSLVTHMNYMFAFCTEFILLDLSNFNTSLVVAMNSMFKNCINLISIDLKNFNTSSLRNIAHMFYNCYNLISLDLSNFDTSTVTYMLAMFYNCKNLISLDLNNFSKFNISNDADKKGIFSKTNPYLIYCINNIDPNNEVIKQINQLIPNSINNCSDICFNKNKKILYNSKACEFNCSNIDIFNYNNICYSSCPKGTHNISENTCIKDNYKIKYDYSSSIELDINLNTSDLDSSSVTEIPNNIENNNISLIHNYNEYFYNLIKPINNENDFSIKISNELEKGNLNDFINIIEKENKDIIIIDNDKNIIYQLTSSYNQRNNIYNNISSINLGVCETKLKLYYNITTDTPLLILKMDIYEKGL